MSLRQGWSWLKGYQREQDKKKKGKEEIKQRLHSKLADEKGGVC